MRNEQSTAADGAIRATRCYRRCCFFFFVFLLDSRWTRNTCSGRLRSNGTFIVVENDRDFFLEGYFFVCFSLHRAWRSRFVLSTIAASYNVISKVCCPVFQKETVTKKNPARKSHWNSIITESMPCDFNAANDQLLSAQVWQRIVQVVQESVVSGSKANKVISIYTNRYVHRDFRWPDAFLPPMVYVIWFAKT